MRRWLFPLIALSSLACALEACGDDDAAAPSPNDAGSTDATVTPADSSTGPTLDASSDSSPAVDAGADAPANDAAPVDGGPFALFVALGGGTAAGYAGYGIDPSSQNAAYPARIASAIDAGFAMPLLTDAGCPAANQTSPAAEGTCARASTGPIQNLAVPRARVVDATEKNASPSQLETLFLGNATQASALAAMKPTFVAVHLADEDVLLPAVKGVLGDVDAGAEPDLLSASAFQTRYTNVVTEIAKVTTLHGVVLVGLVDASKYVSHLQPGAFFFLARDASNTFMGKPVNASCSPVTQLGTPNPLAANLVSFSVFFDAAIAEVSCDPSTQSGQYLLDAAEALRVKNRVAEYNAIIAAHAQARGWAYFDPNPLLEAQYTTKDGNGRYSALRRCQDIATATTLPQFQQAILDSCPVAGATGATPIFGSFHSTDGIYPGAAGQALLAAGIAGAINARYGTSLPTSY